MPIFKSSRKVGVNGVFKLCRERGRVMKYSKEGGGRVGGGGVFSDAGSGGYGMMLKTFREVGRGRKVFDSKGRWE